MSNLNEIKNGTFLVHSSYGNQNFIENKFFNNFSDAEIEMNKFYQMVKEDELGENENETYSSEIFEIKDVEALKTWIEKQTYGYELDLEAVMACGFEDDTNDIIELH